MKILALEFSTSKRSVAVAVDGVVLGYAEISLGQATPALGLVEQALKEAGLARSEVECVAIGLGPGSYAGIRTALALAQGFAMTGRVSAVGVSSALALATEAQQLGLIGGVCALVNAQRGEYYASDYEVAPSGVWETYPLRIVGPAAVRQWIGMHRQLVGPDLAQVLPEVKPFWPNARVVARLAQGSDGTTSPDMLKPIYLRETTFKKAGVFSGCQERR